ncbi:MAG: PAS domain-containing protein [Rhodocyclales bacterium]|nr:PAS domain-containing protein [Rhodocyclales bacterium]
MEDPVLSDTHWKSLRYFNLYRFVLAALLFVAAAGSPLQGAVFVSAISRWHLALTGGYLLLTLLSVMSLHRVRSHFNLQLTAQVLLDVFVLTALMYAGGGLRSGFGWLLLVSLAGAGLVGQGRLVLFFAATATLAVLASEFLLALRSEFESVGFFQAGLLSLGFFATAISGRLLARRVLANEELARQRGIALRNQMLVSQRVIEEMQDGILVVSQDAVVRQHNPRAEALLGVREASTSLLSSYSPALADGFRAWQAGGTAEPEPFRVATSGLILRARFVPTESSDHDVLVFLEDMGRVQQRAQQLKLAALGRLTANIAHEIRNPLSAISHAGELLLEEHRGQPQERLLTIVRDNTQRLDRIVRDVLELGRRDRAHREAIDLAVLLPLFREEFAVKEQIDPGVVALELSGDARICFDRSHLHQVLWNLLGNALRHSRRQAGSLTLRVHNGRGAGLELHVLDDGAGVPADLREHVFEPFFTTHSRGTGLGLYIARELCEANGARLELLENSPGGHFRITGGGSCDCQ